MLYREILAEEPGNADALHLLGLILHQRGQAEQALPYFAAAIEADPHRAMFYSNLGRVYHALGRLDAELAAYRRALEIDPAFAPALLHLALAMEESGQRSAAIAYLHAALRIKPDYAEAHFNLGLFYQREGMLEMAVAEYQEAARHSPRPAAAHFNRGNALRQQQQLQAAVNAYQEALNAEPQRFDARLNLGQVLGELGRCEESLACFQMLAEAYPERAETHDAMAATLLTSADAAGARAECLRALELLPDGAAVHSRALGCEQYLPGTSEATLATSHAEWNRRHAVPLHVARLPHVNQRDPERRLRWGFVAPEFGDNPVGYFLIRTLEALDPLQAEVFCYADRTHPEPLTARFQRVARQWRDAGGASDEALAEQIRNDQVDVLFDLAGHTADNRLLVFARKPAPVQIAWAAYPGTTGLDAMDYLIADPRQIPVGCEQHYREQVLRLPESYVCYAPPDDAPEVGSLPALRNGYVTFGSFNNPLKISTATASAWGAILRRVPGARLRLKYFGLDQASPRERVLSLLLAEGIGLERIQMEGGSPRLDLLAAYRQIDVALDTTPYSGGLTTCEALWMGVPVVTLPGDTFAGRHAASHLAAAGLEAWIAPTREGYLETAIDWASDLNRLAEWRAGLRARVQASPLCDGRRLARHLERLVREAWRRWATAPP